MNRVVWVKAALDQLAEIWMGSDTATRRWINEAVRRIDGLLSAAPSGAGESRSEGRRIMIERPLVVVFRVIAEQGVVQVLTVRKIRGRTESNGQH